MQIEKIYHILLTLIVISIGGCTNPFAPSVNTDFNNGNGAISDQKTIDGVFQNFQYSYTFRDTLIYGKLLAGDFVFTYHDYEQGFDVSWGRDEEMRATDGLFKNSQRLDLIWNRIVLSTEDSLNANIVRGFNLNVTLNPTDVPHADGRVNMSLRKDPETLKWQITRWIDESNF
jgi:hypothetical protein